MAITRLKLERFSAFESLDFRPSSGINAFVGANGTGKTHLMKVAYAACDISKTAVGFAEKLIRVFMPSGRSLGRLVKRRRGSTECLLEIRRDDKTLKAVFSNHATVPDSALVSGARRWALDPVESVYIPVKEMLANAPGFLSLYSQREVHFEEIYADIINRAYTPPLRGPVDSGRRKLLDALQKTIDGKVTTKKEEFFLRNAQGNLEFTLLAEGMRKLGLLWVLIQNRALIDGSVLFWDEPETNLNPKLYGPVIDILLNLQRGGVQIFIATHDYAILKELDLRKEENDEIAFHSLYRDSESREIVFHTADDYANMHPNAIAEAFDDLYDREVQRTLGGSGE